MFTWVTRLSAYSLFTLVAIGRLAVVDRRDLSEIAIRIR
jgi:hypothetical protein